MAERTAACTCGQLRFRCRGEPRKVSMFSLGGFLSPPYLIRARFVGSRAHFGPWYRRLAVAALVALLLRAWIPPGFMPASDGSLALVLCPGTAPVLTSPPAHHGLDARHHHDGQGDRGAEAPCPFGVAAVAAGPPAPVTLAPPPELFAALQAPPRVARVSADFPHLLPPSTGPPAHL